MEAAPSVATNSLLRLVGLKPAAPSGRSRQAERRESQGALARLCKFPGLHPHTPPVYPSFSFIASRTVRTAASIGMSIVTPAACA